MHPATREGSYQGDADRYRQEASDADWSDFRFSVLAAREHDGEYEVTIRIDGGIDAIPSFLRDRGLVAGAPGGDVERDGYVVVEIIDPAGPSGILVIP